MYQTWAKLVLVQGVVCAGLVVHDARVGLRRPLRIRVKQHLAGLPWPADDFPFAIVTMDIFRGMVPMLFCVHTNSPLEM